MKRAKNCTLEHRRSEFLNRFCHPSAGVGDKELEAHHKGQEDNRDTETLTFAITHEFLNIPKLNFYKKTVNNQRETHSVIKDIRSKRISLLQNNPPKLVSSNSVFLNFQLIMKSGGCHKGNTTK